MDADSESRQGVLVAASANLAATNYTLAATKAKLATARNLRIKGQAKQPEPTRCTKNVANLRRPDLLEHETLGYERGSSSHF